MFRLKVENVATPLAAATVLVPARVPLAGLVPIATVMLVVAGGTVKTTFAAGPTPVGWVGPALLPAHPPSATPQSATPNQNAQRRRGASDGSSRCWARGGLR